METLRKYIKRIVDEKYPGLFDLVEDMMLMSFYLRVWVLEDLCERLKDERII